MSEIESNPEKRIALFQRKEIRRTIHKNEWWFVVLDVIAALTDSVNPKGYFTDMRRRDPQLAEALKGGGKLPPPSGRMLPAERPNGPPESSPGLSAAMPWENVPQITSRPERAQEM